MKFRCAWCMKKIKQDKSLFGLNVKFADGLDYSDYEGSIKQVALSSRKTSIPMIVTASGSEAKECGIDGIFAICSDTCGEKMKRSLAQELKLFKEIIN